MKLQTAKMQYTGVGRTLKRNHELGVVSQLFDEFSLFHCSDISLLVVKPISQGNNQSVRSSVDEVVRACDS